MASVGKSANFPEGLRVLVVDDDSTCLLVTQRILQYCKYEVTSCKEATRALQLLRERKGGFDLVITDVRMPNMDGFELLEHIKIEIGLPVIMMSATSKAEDAMKGLAHGACFFLTKPVTINQLNDIWQHVYKKMECDKMAIDREGSVDLKNKRVSEDNECSTSVNKGNKYSKMRRVDNEIESDKEETEDTNSPKKPRIVWNPTLHKQFLEAIGQIGFEKSIPKKILEVMNVPGLTRENVASHLQKYRLFLRRINEEGTINPNGSMSLSARHLKSTFAAGFPQFMYDMHQQGFPKTSEQTNQDMVQPGCAGSNKCLDKSVKVPATNSLHFVNQENNNSESNLNPSGSRSLPTRHSRSSFAAGFPQFTGGRVGKNQSLNISVNVPLPAASPSCFSNQVKRTSNSKETLSYLHSLLNNQPNIHQVPPQSTLQPRMPSYRQRSTENPGFQMAQNHMSSSSPSHGYIPTDHSGVTDSMQVRPELYGSAQLGNNFNLPTDLSNMGQLESTGGHTQLPIFDYTKIFGGIQISNEGFGSLARTGSIGDSNNDTNTVLPQTGSIGESTNNTNVGLPLTGSSAESTNDPSMRYNSLDEIINGKMADEMEGRPIQVPAFSLLNFGNADTQELSGMPQSRSIGEALDNINMGCDLLDAISQRKMLVEMEGRTTQVPDFRSSNFDNADNRQVVSFGELMSSDEPSGEFSNMIVQQNDLFTGFYSNREVGTLLELVTSSALEKNRHLPEEFSDADLEELFLNLPQDGTNTMENNFDISEYELEDTPNAQ